ncbi:MAG: hypothetical protein ACR2ML_04750 [Solirubrobacteraceae bacterium]
MTALLRLGAFALLLAAVFGAAALAGAAVDPASDEKDDIDHGAEMDGMAGEGEGPLPGLSSSAGDYRLVLDRTRLRAGARERLTFRILDAAGRPLRDGYQVEQGKRLHLIVVRRDLTGFQHLHPVLRADGTWTTDLVLPSPGAYRAFADFQVDGERTTLGADLFAPGDFRPAPPPAPTRSALAPGGYEVGLTGPMPVAGRETELAFTVRRGGRPVEALEPYLGARGHLVALREGDLAYLHVHPEQATGGGPIRFAVDLPTAGRYRLFLQFRDAGQVRTAALTQEVVR